MLVGGAPNAGWWGSKCWLVELLVLAGGAPSVGWWSI